MNERRQTDGNRETQWWTRSSKKKQGRNPAAGRGEFMLIEDDGVTLDYQRGKYVCVQLQVEAKPDAISLRAQVSGDYRLPYKNIEFILSQGENRPVVTQGQSWVDDQRRTHFVVAIDSK